MLQTLLAQQIVPSLTMVAGCGLVLILIALIANHVPSKKVKAPKPRLSPDDAYSEMVCKIVNAQSYHDLLAIPALINEFKESNERVLSKSEIERYVTIINDHKEDREHELRAEFNKNNLPALSTV